MKDDFPLLSDDQRSISACSSENRFKEPYLGYWGGLVNLMKGFVGPFVFVMPVAVKNGGLVGSALGMALVLFVSRWCLFLLIDSTCRLYAAVGVSRMTYSEVFEHVLALNRSSAVRRCSLAGRYMLSGCILCVMIGVGIANMIFISRNVMKIVDGTHPELELPYRAYPLGLFLVLLIYFAVRHLKHLVPLTALANVLMTFCVVGTTGYCFYLIANDLNVHWKQSEINYFGSPTQLIVFLSTLLAPYIGVVMVLPVENQLEDRDDMTKQPFGLINVVTVYSIIVYGLMGYVGYVTFGDWTTAVTFNLPHSAGIVVLIVAVCLISFVNIGLAMYVFGVVIRHKLALAWERVGSVRKLDVVELLADYTSRLTFLLICSSFAVFLPFVEEMIAVIGSFAASPLMCVFPSLFHILLMPEMSRLQQYDAANIDWASIFRRPSFWLNLFICLFGLFCWISGTVVSVVGMIRKSSQNQHFFACKMSSLNCTGLF